MWKNILLTRVKYSDVDHFTTPVGLTFRRYFNPIYRRILSLCTGHKVHLESYPKLEKGKPYIFASTHLFVEDIITNLSVIDRNAYMLIGTPDQVEHNPLLYAAWVNGMVFVNKLDAESVDKMERILKSGSSAVLYPEGSWNNTENLLVQPLFAGPWLLAQRTGCKVVPISFFHEYKAKDIYVRVGKPMDLAPMAKWEALDKLRDAMASMVYEMMAAHATVLKRSDLGPNPRTDYMEERMQEYLRTKWTRDSWAEEVTIYRDKTLPPQPEAVRASFDNVKITIQNAAILAPTLARREEDKKYNLVKYMQRNWKK